DNYRLRYAPPEKPGFLGYHTVVHWATMTIRSLYPIFLNTAPSVRTSVEALETRGFTYAPADKRRRDIRLAYLKISGLDIAVLALTLVGVVMAFVVGDSWPVYRGSLSLSPAFWLRYRVLLSNRSQ